MNSDQPVVLVVGATGRTGRLIVEAAARHEMRPRALVRDPDRARPLVPAAEVVKGDLEDVSTLTHAVSGIDAVIFAHGSDRDVRPDAFERIDYREPDSVKTEINYLTKHNLDVISRQETP
jgi:uncharacterized protein YbjT (DUF2867 family)